jgi:calcium-dependent protein kinase
VQKALKADPQKRMSCNDACAHEWLKNSPESASACPETSASVMKSLKAFAGQSTFTRLCITAVARQLDHRHLKDIHQVFQELDKDGNGVLSIAEVKEGIGKLGAGEATDVEKLFATMDIDGSKQIDYTEFCAAAMGERATNQDDIIWAAFKTFDVDNSGDLTVDNIKTILDNADVMDSWSPEVCREVGMEVIKMFDKDGDGKICFEDFKTMMTKCWNKSNDTSMDALSILNKVSMIKDEDIK